MVSTLILTKQIYQYLNEKRYEINKLENETITMQRILTKRNDYDENFKMIY